MIRIEPVTPERMEAAQDVVRRAFGDEGDAVSRVVTAIRESDLYRPELDLIAIDDETVVGYVLVSGCTLANRTVALLSPLAVDPDRQRVGIGAALIAHALETADQFGEPIVVLEGDPAYYGPRGFAPAADYGLVLPIPDWAPPEAAQVAVLSSYDGADPSLRGEISYPPAFDLLG